MKSRPGKVRRTIGWLLLFVVDSITSLKNLKITVPQRVRIGGTALLSCSYDLEDVQLYTIKWYLDEHEFYRYVPKKEPPYSTFNVRDIQVNVSNSNTHEVRLDNLQRDHTGRYKCEVTEEAPHYDTKIQEADVTVVDVPAREPKITVDRERPAAGKTLRARCESGAASTAPNITWTLNGVPLDNMKFKFRTSVHKYDDFKKRHNKSYTLSTLILNTSGFFHDNHIQLGCSVEISQIYKASTVIEIDKEAPHIAPITGDASLHSRQSNGCGLIASPTFSFIITKVSMPILVLDLLIKATSI